MHCQATFFFSTTYKVFSLFFQFFFFFFFQNKKERSVCLLFNKMENCGPHCFALGDDFAAPEGCSRRCLSRVFHENKARWIAGENLAEISIYSCRYAPVSDKDVAFLADLPPASLDQIESLVVSFCDVSDWIVEWAAVLVRGSQKIRTVIIHSNNLTERCYAPMAKALEFNSSLCDLVIYNPSKVMPLDEIQPLFTYALVVNPDRPETSSWSFTNPKAGCGGDYEMARDVAAGVLFLLDRREEAKKKNRRAAKIVSQVPTVSFKEKMRNLRKYRRNLNLLKDMETESSQSY